MPRRSAGRGPAARGRNLWNLAGAAGPPPHPPPPHRARPRNLWSLDGAAGHPRIPGIPGSAVSPALVSRRSWRAGPVPAPLWKDRISKEMLEK
eukprot:gene16901-biopygen769